MSDNSQVNKKFLENLVNEAILDQKSSNILLQKPQKILIEQNNDEKPQKEEESWFSETWNQVAQLSSAVLSQKSKEFYYAGNQVFQAMANIELPKFDTKVKSFFALYSDFDIELFECKEGEKDIFGCDVFFNPRPYRLSRAFSNLLSSQKLITKFVGNYSQDAQNLNLIPGLEIRKDLKYGFTSDDDVDDERIKRPELQMEPITLEEQNFSLDILGAKKAAIQKIKSGKNTVKFDSDGEGEISKQQIWQLGTRESVRRQKGECPLNFNKEGYRSGTEGQQTISDEEWCERWKSGMRLPIYKDQKAGQLFNDGLKKDREYFNSLRNQTKKNGEFGWVDGITEEEYQLQMSGGPNDTPYIPGMRPDNEKTKEIKKNRELYKFARSSGLKLAQDRGDAGKVLSSLRQKAAGMQRKELQKLLEFFWLSYYSKLDKSKYTSGVDVADDKAPLVGDLAKAYMSVYEWLSDAVKDEFGGLGIIDSGTGRELVDKYFILNEQEANRLARYCAKAAIHPQLFAILCFRAMHLSGDQKLFNEQGLKSFALKAETSYKVETKKLSLDDLGGLISYRFDQKQGPVDRFTSDFYQVSTIFRDYVKAPIFKQLKGADLEQANESDFSFQFGIFSMLMRIDPTGDLKPQEFLETFKDYTKSKPEDAQKQDDQKDFQAGLGSQLPAFIFVSTPEAYVTSKLAKKLSSNLSSKYKALRNLKAARLKRERIRKKYKEELKAWKKKPKSTRAGRKPKGKIGVAWRVFDTAMAIAPTATVMALYWMDPVNVWDRKKIEENFKKSSMIIEKYSKEYKALSEVARAQILEVLDNFPENEKINILRRAVKTGAWENSNDAVDLMSYFDPDGEGRDISGQIVAELQDLPGFKERYSDSGDAVSETIMSYIMWEFNPDEMEEFKNSLNFTIEEIIKEYARHMNYMSSALGKIKEKEKIKEKLKISKEVFSELSKIRRLVSNILEEQESLDNDTRFVFNYLNADEYVKMIPLLGDVILNQFDKNKRAESSTSLTFEGKEKQKLVEQSSPAPADLMWIYAKGAAETTENTYNKFIKCGKPEASEEEEGVDFEDGEDITTSNEDLKPIIPLKPNEAEIFKSILLMYVRAGSIRSVKMGDLRSQLYKLTERSTELNKQKFFENLENSFQKNKSAYINKYKNTWRDERNSMFNEARSSKWVSLVRLSTKWPEGLMMKISPMASGFFSSSSPKTTYFLGLPYCFGSTDQKLSLFPNHGLSSSIVCSNRVKSELLGKDGVSGLFIKKSTNLSDSKFFYKSGATTDKPDYTSYLNDSLRAKGGQDISPREMRRIVKKLKVWSDRVYTYRKANQCENENAWKEAKDRFQILLRILENLVGAYNALSKIGKKIESLSGGRSVAPISSGLNSNDLKDIKCSKLFNARSNKMTTIKCLKKNLRKQERRKLVNRALTSRSGLASEVEKIAELFYYIEVFQELDSTIARVVL